MPAVLSSKSCRIIFTFALQFISYWSNVELRETSSFIVFFSQAPFTFALQFISYWSNFELHSTELYFLPGQMSNLERRRLLLCSFLKLHLHLSFNLALIGPMSSYTRQTYTSYHVQCRAQRDTVFCLCSFLKLRLHLPLNLALIGPMSSYTRQTSTSYQVQCRT